ncbi:hypothetical protein F5B18DRAFT_646945 [Nemania serpens]|nr:hypothetical protein F5B18DRAFT_646945 [Nemania serpens]
MGLLSFLSKKSYPDLTEHGSLKTSAYNATVASSPPIRGAYPVRGNGRKILEKFQRSHPNPATVSHHNTPAPSPLVPRRVGDGLHGPGEERPRTAPSKQPVKTAGRSSLQSQPKPGLPLPSKKKFGPYRLPSKVVTDIQASSLTAKPAQSPGLASLYSDSVSSGESSRTKGYIDLLDAQSMIRPSDFYGRIQATGTKNYGEDVADRNMKDKSTSRHTEIAQGQLPTYADAKWTSAIAEHVDNDPTEELTRRPRIRHSFSSSLQSTHTSPDSFPKRTSSRLPPNGAHEVPKPTSGIASARLERTARRKSMPSLESETRRSSSTVRKGKGKDPDIYPDIFPDSLRDRALAATAHERENTRSNISTKRQSPVPPHVEQPLGLKFNDLDKPLPTPPSYSRDQPRRKTVSHYSTLVEPRLPVKRQSLTGMRIKSRGELYEDTYQEKVSLRNAQTPRDQNSARRQLGSTTDLQDFLSDSPAQQLDNIPQMISSLTKFTNNKDKLSQINHTRKQSLISLSSASIKAYEMETPVPERASSLSRWSLASETAMSTLSSNPFRPQSGHTTNTSVDFSPKSPLAHRDLPSLKPLSFISRDTSAATSPTSPTSPPSTRNHQSSDFYLEDYASSIDSSTSPSRGSYEEDLLFSETGYGICGPQISGLPGLFDVDVPTSSADMLTSRALENGLDSIPELPIYPYTDSDYSLENPEQTDSSDDEMNFDIPMRRASSGLRDIMARHRFPELRQPVSEDGDDPGL